MARFRLVDNAKRIFEVATDVFQRVGSRNERLSLAYGLIAWLAWGVLAPSSAMATCAPYVKSRTTAGLNERLIKALSLPDAGFASSSPHRRGRCPLCSSKQPAPPPLPAAVPPPHVQTWAFLTAAATPSLSGDWFSSEQDRSRPIHRHFLILHPPRPAR
jgi:hypothetical protein